MKYKAIFLSLILLVSVIFMMPIAMSDGCTGPNGAECDRYEETTDIIGCNNDELCQWVVGDISPCQAGVCGNERAYPEMAGFCDDFRDLVACNSNTECRWYDGTKGPCPAPTVEECEGLVETRTGSCGGTSGGLPIPGCDQFTTEFECQYIGECNWFWSKEGFCDSPGGATDPPNLEGILKDMCISIEKQDSCEASGCDWRNREEPCSECPPIPESKSPIPLAAGTGIVMLGAGIVIGRKTKE